MFYWLSFPEMIEISFSTTFSHVWSVLCGITIALLSVMIYPSQPWPGEVFTPNTVLNCTDCDCAGMVYLIISSNVGLVTLLHKPGTSSLNWLSMSELIAINHSLIALMVWMHYNLHSGSFRWKKMKHARCLDYAICIANCQTFLFYSMFPDWSLFFRSSLIN